MGIVQSDAVDVDGYLAGVPDGRRAVLTKYAMRAEGCYRALPSP